MSLNGGQVQNHNQAPALQGEMARNWDRGNVAGAACVVALGVGTLALLRSRPLGRHQRAGDQRRNLAAYLSDHLAGADAAIRVVSRLMRRYDGTREGALFAFLDEQFREDRAAAVALLTSLGASSRSIKRLAGRAAGELLHPAAGGSRGQLALFRTLEGLAVGVQGKRCLWRAAQALGPSVRAGDRSFVQLEARAVAQWERIEEYRRALVRQTFVG